MASWDFDCPQYVDFTAPHPLDDCDTDFFDAAPSNICKSLDEWKKKTTSQPQNPPNITQEVTRPVTRSSDQTAPPDVPVQPVQAVPEKQTEAFTQPLQRKLPTRGSVKRSHSFTRDKGEQIAQCSSPAAKSLKRSNSTTNIGTAQRTLKRSACSSSSQESQPKVIKRASSFTNLRQSQRAQSQTRLGQRRQTPTQSPRTRSRSSSIGAHPVRLRTLSASRERLQNLGNQSTVSDDHPNNCRTQTHHRGMPKLTLCTTPSFMRRPKFMSTSQNGKTTEEMQMEQIAVMRKEIKDRRKKNDETYKKSLAPYSSEPALNLKLTQPEEFHFQTDSRVKTHKVETRSEEINFVRSLRSNTQPQKLIPARGITMVKPFNLTEGKKQHSEDKQSSEKFVSMAESVKAFHRQTPDRFRSKTKTGPTTRAQSKSPPRMTIPKTPSFETRSRTRPVSAMSRQEQEEKELEEIRNNQFRAHPVNQKIFSHPELGLKKVESKPATQIEEFSLTSDRRVKGNGVANNSTQEEKFEFKARPIPSNILEKVVGVKPGAKEPLTVPQSPAFALKHRAHLPRRHQDKEEDTYVPFKRNPVPHTGIPFQPKLAQKQVVVEPFTFEEREKERRAKKQEKMKQKEEESKVPSFHANPLPFCIVSGEVVLPPKAPKPATVPQPFDLELDKRGRRRQVEFNQKVEEERQREKEMASFKHQETTVLEKDPFIPKKSNKPLTDITEFELNTERRAHVRENLEQKKKQRESEINLLITQEEVRKTEEERDAVNRIRQEMVHRANPVRQYKSVAIHPSDKPLTTPMTPQLCTSRVRRFRNTNPSPLV